MLLRRYGTFSGGIDLPDDKQATRGLPIEAAPIPACLRVPLTCSAAPPALPLVEPGQSVTAGQKIAAGQNGADVFAPLPGRVTRLVNVSVAGPRGWLTVPALELRELGTIWRTPWSAAQPPEESPADLASLDAQAIRERLSLGGLCLHRRNAEPMAAWLERALSHKVRTLIANVMEDEPYVTADHRLLVEQGRHVLRGLTLIARAIGVQQVMLAADQRYTDRYRPLDRCEPSVERFALPHKYPMGSDAVLVKVLTRRETPPGQSTMAVGAAVLDAATCLAAYRLLTFCQPPLGRAVTLSGERAAHPANLWVALGTPCRELLNVEGELLHGGPMTGLRCRDDSVVTFATDALLAIEPSDIPVPSPCIRCSWCTDHCPARLNVTALNDAFELGLLSHARRLGADACMECGVCSYVCPARLPLSQRTKQLKYSILGSSPAAVKP